MNAAPPIGYPKVSAIALPVCTQLTQLMARVWPAQQPLTGLSILARIAPFLIAGHVQGQKVFARSVWAYTN